MYILPESNMVETDSLQMYERGEFSVIINFSLADYREVSSS